MTVKQFIKMLQLYPQDYVFIIEDYNLYEDPEQFEVNHNSEEVIYYPSY
jgi:hypothetical protein